MVVIKGADDWKNIKIRLYPQDEVTIGVSGKVCFRTFCCNDALVDANGWDWIVYKDDWPGDFNY